MRRAAGSGWIATGAVLAGLAVVAGAFAAHALKAKISPEMLEVFQTGARYHMTHAMALMLAGLMLDRAGPRAAELIRIAAWAFCIGIILFSGSLYALSHGAPRWCGMITPFGGLAFMAGWGLMAAGALRRE